MKDNLIKPAVAVIIGGYIAVHARQEVRIFILAFFILSAFYIWYFWKPKDFYGRFRRPEVIILACSLVIGFFYGMSAERTIPSHLMVKDMEFEGEITDWGIDKYGLRGTFILQSIREFGEVTEITIGKKVEAGAESKTYTERAYEVIGSQIGRKYAIRAYPDSKGDFLEGWDSIKPGDYVRLKGKLEHPKPPGTAGEFDLPLYNAVRNLSGSITAKGEAIILAEGNPGITWRIRKNLQNVLNQYWPEKAGVLEGILFGDSSRIPLEDLDRYKAAGVLHVFAASGANVAFVMALVWGAFFFLPRRFRIVASMAGILLYAALCHGNPPILRATIIGSAVLIGMFGRGRIPPLRWLLLAGLILFALNPLYLKDTSFQLSFAAAWGMIVLSPRLEKISWISRLPQLLRAAVSVTLAAQIATFPILIDVFHRISIVGLITNVVVLFILGAVLQLGLIGTSLLLIPIIPLAFFQSAFWLLNISDVLISFFASLPLADFWVLNPGMIFWLIWYVALAVILLGRDKVWFILLVQWKKLMRTLNQSKLGQTRIIKAIRNKLTGFQGKAAKTSGGLLQEDIGPFNKSSVFLKQKRFVNLLVLMVFIFLLLFPSIKADRLVVTFLDVGQGDCILIESPSEKILIDTGPRTSSFDAGERIIVPYFMQRRIGSLDMVFITHEDADHIGGAKYILSNIPIDKLVVPEIGDRLLSSDWQEGVPSNYLFDEEKLLRLKAGDRLLFSSGLVLEVLAPVEVIEEAGANSNNNSLVILLEYLGKKVLLTGDMEKEEMQQIFDRGVNYDANFIKIPHHGSAGSLDTIWFDRTNPQAIFIPVGRNSFGHPTPAVLDYWQQRGVPVYRTDLNGTIQLIIDEDGYNIISGRD